MAGRYVALVSDLVVFPSKGTYTIQLRCLSGPCDTTAKVSSYGAGCRGTAGVPKLAAPDLPIVGTAFTLNMTNLSTVRFTQAVLFVGAPKVDISLDALGMTGCRLFVRLPTVIEVPVVVQSGQAQWKFGIPLDPTLVGVKAYLQGYATDRPTATPWPNPLGVTNSNGIEAIIG